MNVNCPLCSNLKLVKLKQYKISQLAENWIKTFGFNPFVEIIDHEYIKKMRCANCDLIFYNPSRPGDHKFYELLTSIIDSYYEEERWEFDTAIDMILEYKPKSLLELGCGSGSFLDKIKSCVEHTEGIEINQNAIDSCQKKNLNVSSKKINEINRKYEIIVLFEVLEHLDNIHEILSNIVERLEDNGFLLIAVPNPEGYLKDCGIVLLDLPPHHSLSISAKVFDYIGKTYNLEKIHYSIEPIRYVHYF